MPLLIAIGLVVASTAGSAQQAGTYCHYEPGSLRSALELGNQKELTPGTVSVLRPIPRYRIPLLYTGEFRARGRWHFELMAAYSMEARIGRIFDSYLNEVRVTEAGEDYWMPLDESTRKHLRSSFSKNDSVVGFVDLAGAVVNQRGRDWLFVLRQAVALDSVEVWLREQCASESSS